MSDEHTDLDELAPMFASEVGAHPVARRQALRRVCEGVLGRRPVPVRIGRYVVLDLLGEGGAGAVFSALDEELDRQVAIKLVRDHGAADVRERARQRLIREAQALAQLNHPNVVTIFDVGTTRADELTGRNAAATDEQVFLAMERVSGVDLARWLRQSARGWPEILRVFLAAGKGLAAAHAIGIVHRDFKPGNVLIADDGRVLVADFGLARGMQTDDEPTHEDLPASESSAGASWSSALAGPLTQIGATPGTPGYMAPEQRLGSTSPASDQFSFCMSLYEALLAAHGPPPPRALVRVVTRGLASPAAKRHPDMPALLRALEAARRPRLAPRLAAGSLALAAVGALELYEPAKPPCAAGVDGDEPLWTRERRDAIHDAFAATGTTFALDAWNTVDGRLTTWTEQWRRLRADSCEAPPPCLARSALELAALLRELEHADATTVQHAPSAVMQLATPMQCADEHADRDAAVGTRRFAELLAEAWALELAGRYRDALATATTVVTLAGEIGDDAMAQALARRGSIHMQLGEYEQARVDLTDAVWFAGAAGSDAVALSAATRLVFLLGSRLARPSDAEAWIQHASALLVRAPSERGEADLANAECAVHIAAERPEEAITSCERSKTLRAATLGADHPDVAGSTSNAALAHQLHGDFARAIELDERALAVRTKVFGAFHPQIAMSWNSLGASKSNRGDEEAALADFARALAILESTLGPEHPHTLLTLNNIALSESRLARFDAADAHYRQVLDVRRRVLGADHPDTAQTWNGLGLVAEQRGDWQEAVAAHRRALEIRTAVLGAEHPDTAQSLLNLAQASSGAGQPERALELAREAAVARERVLGEHVHTAEALVFVARLEVDAEQYARAVLTARRAVRIAEAARARDDRGVLPALAVAALAEAAAGNCREAERARARIDAAAELGEPARTDVTRSSAACADPH